MSSSDVYHPSSTFGLRVLHTGSDLRSLQCFGCIVAWCAQTVLFESPAKLPLMILCSMALPGLLQASKATHPTGGRCGSLRGFMFGVLPSKIAQDHGFVSCSAGRSVDVLPELRQLGCSKQVSSKLSHDNQVVRDAAGHIRTGDVPPPALLMTMLLASLCQTLQPYLEKWAAPME